jgi:hypothetical protein
VVVFASEEDQATAPRSVDYRAHLDVPVLQKQSNTCMYDSDRMRHTQRERERERVVDLCRE